MSNYVKQILNPFNAPEEGVPDLFARKSAIFKITKQGQIKSSTANGQIAGYFAPQAFSDPGTSILTYLTDGANNLNVSNMPAFINLTATNLVGETLSTYYTYVRLVGAAIKLTYIGRPIRSTIQKCRRYRKRRQVCNMGCYTILWLRITRKHLPISIRTCDYRRRYGAVNGKRLHTTNNFKIIRP